MSTDAAWGEVHQHWSVVESTAAIPTFPSSDSSQQSNAFVRPLNNFTAKGLDLEPIYESFVLNFFQRHHHDDSALRITQTGGRCPCYVFPTFTAGLPWKSHNNTPSEQNAFRPVPRCFSKGLCARKKCGRSKKFHVTTGNCELQSPYRIVGFVLVAKPEGDDQNPKAVCTLVEFRFGWIQHPTLDEKEMPPSGLDVGPLK